MAAAGKARHFEILQPWLDGGSPGDAVVTAAELQLSANALKVAVHRLRERFRQKIRDGIAATVADPAAVADEFRYLVDVLVR
jgi:RNA polymerase sigma-70 factor (ECF subfamily)